jgi:hypothetical protein
MPRQLRLNLAAPNPKTFQEQLRVLRHTESEHSFFQFFLCPIFVDIANVGSSFLAFLL